MGTHNSLLLFWIKLSEFEYGGLEPANPSFISLRYIWFPRICSECLNCEEQVQQGLEAISKFSHRTLKISLAWLGVRNLKGCERHLRFLLTLAAV